jgi:hypothetical protein
MKFDKNSLDESEGYFKKLHIFSEQRRKIRLMAKSATNYIQINEHAMTGFAYRAIQEIQFENKMEFNIFESINDNEKLKIANEIFDRVGSMPKKAILKPELSNLLNKAINESYEFYKNKVL